MLVPCAGHEPETLMTFGPLRSASCASALLMDVVEQTIVRVCSAPFVRQGPLQVVWLTVTCAAAGRGARRITANTAAAQTRNTRRERDTTVIERSFLTGASRAAGGPRV